MSETPVAYRFPLLDSLEHADRFVEYVEEQMVGPHLLDLVRDLAAVNPGGGRLPLPDALRNRVIDVGLAGLTEAETQLALGNPLWLIPLQKAVLTAGSPYWDEVIARADRPTLALVQPVATNTATGRLPLWVAGTCCLASAVAVLLVLGWWVADLKAQLAAQDARYRELLTLMAEPPGQQTAADADTPPHLGAYPPEGFGPHTSVDPCDLEGGDPNDLPIS